MDFLSTSTSVWCHVCLSPNCLCQGSHDVSKVAYSAWSFWENADPSVMAPVFSIEHNCRETWATAQSLKKCLLSSWVKRKEIPKTGNTKDKEISRNNSTCVFPHFFVWCISPILQSRLFQLRINLESTWPSLNPSKSSWALHWNYEGFIGFVCLRDAYKGEILLIFIHFELNKQWQVKNLQLLLNSRGQQAFQAESRV